MRIRPNPRGSRPRTKERPGHEDAVPARVLTVDRGRYTTLVGESTDDERLVTAMKARELARSGIVVGDRVALVGDTSGTTDTLARVVRREPRTSVLRRTADDTDPVERVLVANVDQLVVVTALADPEPRPRMVDRCLVAAYDAGLDPLLCLTKADLRDPASFLAAYSDLDVPMVVTRRPPPAESNSSDRHDPIGLEHLRHALEGRSSVLVGHSGVGKSTLVNALVPEAERATGAVNDVTGRGRHTSSSAVALRLRDGDGRPCGWVVDTPGVRSFGLAHVDPQRLLAAFPDLEPGSATCPRACSHDEPDCGLDEFVAAGGAGPAGPHRLDSLRRLLRSRTEEPAGRAD
ncbi:MAG: ribosome small subunit-dependent GTPase A [Actinomycetes bacterium]